MAENGEAKSEGFSIDWLVKGTLTKVGDIFDRLTGRRWKPSSSLATSGLVDRLKRLMDSEVRVDEHDRRYVPHNIQLKMQWDKFSTDSQESLRTLENELLIAAIDHINDRHYYTYSPLTIDIKPDYFINGVVLLVGFDKFDSDENEAAVNVTVDGLTKEDLLPETRVEHRSLTVRVSFEAGGTPINKVIELEEGKRISVGRTKENDLQIDDPSISKAHASLLLSREIKLVVADTGSTNGTFVNGTRIAYGKAVEIAPGSTVMFGLVDVSIQFEMPQSSVKTEAFPVNAESYKIGEFEFSSRPIPVSPAPTAPSVPRHSTRATVSEPEADEVEPRQKGRNDAAADAATQPVLSDSPLNRSENGSEAKQ